MAEILFDFPVAASREKVFEAVATPEGLEKWWAESSNGEVAAGAVWELGFGPGLVWRARVVAYEPGQRVEFELAKADADWTGTRVQVRLEDHPGGLVWVRFAHAGWREAGEHFRISAYCWAMYLRLLKQWVQRGETVPYGRRLEV